MVATKTMGFIRIVMILALSVSLASCNNVRPREQVETKITNRAPREHPVIPDEKLDFTIVSGRPYSSIEEALAAAKNAGQGRKKSPMDDILLNIVRFDDLALEQAASALTEMTAQNIVVSQDATPVKVNVFLRNVSGRTALETICRMNNLWYREERNIIRIVTSEEYTKGLVIQRDERTQIFKLRYASASSIASVVQSIFGEQVIYQTPNDASSYGHVGTDGDDPMNNEGGITSGGGGSGGRSSSSRGQGRTRISRKTPATDAIEQALARDIQASLLERLEEREAGGTLPETVAESKVSELTGQTSFVTLTVFPRNNCIIARSIDDTLLREIGGVVESLDTPTRQVLLEVKILNIQLTNDFESFFDIAGGSGPESTPGSGLLRHTGGSMSGIPGLAASTLSYTFLNRRITANIQFLESTNRIRSIATPLIMCANNAPAEFFIGEERPIITEYEFEVREFQDGTTNELARPITTFREIGTKVRIIPSINRDSTITLRFATEVSSVNQGGANLFDVQNGVVVALPVDTVDSTTVETIVVGKDTKTIVLGGLIRESTNRQQQKVPVLGDLPIVGIAFKKDDDQKTRTEIVILITPHIMQHPLQVDGVSLDVLENLSDHPYAKDDGRERLVTEFEPLERAVIIIPTKDKKSPTRSVEETVDDDAPTDDTDNKQADTEQAGEHKDVPNTTEDAQEDNQDGDSEKLNYDPDANDAGKESSNYHDSLPKDSETVPSETPASEPKTRKREKALIELDPAMIEKSAGRLQEYKSAVLAKAKLQEHVAQPIQWDLLTLSATNQTLGFDWFSENTCVQVEALPMTFTSLPDMSIKSANQMDSDPSNELISKKKDN